MQLKTADIKEILKNYNFIKLQISNGLVDETTKEKLVFVENCINALDDKNKQLIKEFYLDCISKKQLAKKMFISRAGLYKKIDAIINKIIKLYETYKKI